MFQRLSIVMFILVCCPALALGAKWIVQPDGSGHFTTLTAAHDFASDGDIIQIGAGTYTEALIVTKDLVFESISGAGATILDGAGSLRPLEVAVQSDVTFRGLTVQDGYADNGAALFIWEQSTVLVEGCVFADNHAYESNAVHARHPGTSVSIIDCEFLRNRADEHSAALSASMDCYVNVSNCRFVENVAGYLSGAANCYGASMDVSGCLFLRNAAQGTGALVYQFSSGTVSNNTFHGNSGTDNGSVYIADGTVFRNNIVTDDQAGFGLVHVGYGAHFCNLYWGNAAGAILGNALGPDEIVAEPQFCDHTMDDFNLCTSSPALGVAGGCGLMGAFGAACDWCGPVPVEEHAWGDVKAMFR